MVPTMGRVLHAVRHLGRRNKCAGLASERAFQVQHALAAPGHVDLSFGDGSAFRFHSLWLRDSCRDQSHIMADAGERILSTSPVVIGLRNPRVKEAFAEIDKLHVHWEDASVKCSTFSGEFLRSYAHKVAKPLNEIAINEDIIAETGDEWLSPYGEFPITKAPSSDSMHLWGSTSEPEFPVFNYHELADVNVNLNMLKAILQVGLVKVRGAPLDQGVAALHDFCVARVGTMQKDPAREESNWKITHREGAKSISYNPSLRLSNHTDQSVPPHGTPGLLLTMLYQHGYGNNTVVDGFAVAKALRDEDPKAYELLASYGVNAERDFIASRVDASQTHTQSLVVSCKNPIFLTDAQGDLVRIQYNEVFRMPSQLPFDVFPEWYAALEKFVSLIHNPAFERSVPMQTGEMLIFQNWRVLHGRAGHQSPDRTLVGGTVTREAFVSKARQLMRLQA